MASLSLSSAHFSSSRSSVFTSSLAPSSHSLPLSRSPIRRRRRRVSFAVVPRRNSYSFLTSNSQVFLLITLISCTDSIQLQTIRFEFWDYRLGVR